MKYLINMFEYWLINAILWFGFQEQIQVIKLIENILIWTLLVKKCFLIYFPVRLTVTDINFQFECINFTTNKL